MMKMMVMLLMKMMVMMMKMMVMLLMKMMVMMMVMMMKMMVMMMKMMVMMTVFQNTAQCPPPPAGSCLTPVVFFVAMGIQIVIMIGYMVYRLVCSKTF